MQVYFNYIIITYLIVNDDFKEFRTRTAKITKAVDASAIVLIKSFPSFLQMSELCFEL